MFQSFARLVDLQRLKNAKVDPMSVKVGHPWFRVYRLGATVPDAGHQVRASS